MNTYRYGRKLRLPSTAAIKHQLLMLMLADEIKAVPQGGSLHRERFRGADEPAPAAKARPDPHLKKADGNPPLTPQPRRFLPGARDIFGIAAAIGVDAVRRQFQHAVRQRGEKMPVMRHEQHGALVFARAPRSAFPWWRCRDGWSARRAPGNSAGRTASSP